MKEKFVSSSINFISKYQKCDDLKLKRLKYGLEGIYSLVVKTFVVLIISIITQTLIETLLLMIFYAGIRTFSYGMHAKNNITCWITTILIYNGCPLLIANINLPTLMGYIILFIALISMILWAPADTPKKPLIRKEQRKKCKILSIIIILIYTLIFLINKNSIINNSIIYALIIQIIFINPLTYKLTKTQFNNYKYYKKNK
ncbi:accessory gene regulator B superfamily [Mycoplasma sp. CAG:776]|nr:accessory gene regulator B superfamily [Mycoplasma sp. CAG:776]